MACFSRLRNLWKRDALDENLNEELRSHIEMRAELNIAEGMSAEEARVDARTRFGNATLMKEKTRDSDLFTWIESVGKDIRYACRMFLRSPGFTAIAVLSLALGIGATTAIFSVMDALLLRQLPVQNPKEIVSMGYVDSGEYQEAFSFPMFQSLRDGLPQEDFSSISAVGQFWCSNVTTNSGAGSSAGEDALVGLVSANFFTTMGVDAAAGRTFGAEDDRAPGGNSVTVISYSYWKRRFNL